LIFNGLFFCNKKSKNLLQKTWKIAEKAVPLLCNQMRDNMMNYYNFQDIEVFEKEYEEFLEYLALVEEFERNNENNLENSK